MLARVLSTHPSDPRGGTGWNANLIPVALLVALLVPALLLQPTTSFESPLLLTTLNLVFLTVVPLIAAGLAVVAYRRTGVGAILAIGAAMLATGLGGGVIPGALLFVSPNETVTLHNTTVLVAGACHLLAALGAILGISLGSGRTGHVVLVYATIGLVIGAWIVLVVAGMTPLFWGEDGPTGTRQIVLRAAFVLSMLAAFAWWQTAVRDRGIRFLHWYVPGLVLFAIGLAGILGQTVVGGVVGWIGRSAQYLGAVYMLVAVGRETIRARESGGDGMLGISLLQAALPFRPLVESTSDAVVALGRGGRIVYWNEAARSMFGRSLEEAFDADPLDLLLPPTASPEARARLAAVLAAPTSAGDGRHLLTLGDRDGRAFAAEMIAFASRDDPRLVVCVISDVTERVRAREELEERVRERTAELEALNAQLGRANAVKDEFLGLVSHELKTPITSILASSSLLERRIGPDRDGLLDDLVAETARLAGIVDNLLVLARLDAGRSLDHEPVALDRLITSAAAEVARQYPGRTVGIAGERGAIVEGNETQLAMVVRNFVTNALKYSPPSESVEVVLRRAGSTARVSVLDRGIGIPDGDPIRLFEPFRRAPEAEVVTGMGIGLTVCRRIVEAHGGRVGAERRPEGGSVFWFEVPLAPSDAGDEVSVRSAEAIASSPCRLLTQPAGVTPNRRTATAETAIDMTTAARIAENWALVRAPAASPTDPRTKLNSPI